MSRPAVHLAMAAISHIEDNVKNKIKVELSLFLNNKDWKLEDIKGADAVARQLNMEVSRAVNESSDKLDAELICLGIFDKFKKFNASRDVLNQILNAYFGGNK